MTGADFTGVDIDLLADYVGGALDGTPDEARVATLIAGDPAWRDAYAQLSDGMAGIGESLQSWGAAPEPMPDDVLARLETAFAETGGAAPASGRHLSAVRETGVAPARKRRPWRFALPAAVAAAALGLVGVGISYLGTSAPQSSDTTSSAGGSGLTAPELQASVPAGAEISSSGIDYSARTFAHPADVPFKATDDVPGRASQ